MSIHQKEIMYEKVFLNVVSPCNGGVCVLP